MTNANASKTATVAIATAGTILVVGYAVLAALQILVLNPLAAAPGKTLQQIHADLADANESLNAPAAVTILSIGVVVALTLLILLVRLPDATPIVAGLSYALLLMFGTPAYFVASFGAGMGLADTYGISGADYSRWSLVLYAVSGVALITAFAFSVMAVVRGRTAQRGDSPV